MSKSLEALERYYSNLLYGNGGFGTDEEELEGLNAIKQDLERLEVLELNLDSEKYRLVNENQCLKNRVEDLEISYKELKKENLELKEEYEMLDRAYNSCHLDYEDLKGENEKLKKAIEILKDKLCVRKGTLSFTRDNYYLGVNGSFKDIKELTQQEYDLLKEVLGE